jgi:hypothetical protein
MPGRGHTPPGQDPAFELVICTSCNAGDHGRCRPMKRGRRFLFCECLGTDGFRLLPCLPLKEKP